ncbi:peptidylprolyl isomerase [Spirochaeta cellobiosiphila]|uniref:peptidylprolyl isomerase n=1 Tax=Spirochaeta cellobiosiphila TaxID=504483 RepID=UPI0004058EE5|nr:peptidylprolyl isomerase [Spirochaeta cellobiosiphila]
MLKKLTILFFCLSFMITSLFAGGQKDTESEKITDEMMEQSTQISVNNDVVASVNDVDITQTEFNDKMERIKASYAQKGQQLNADQIKEVEKQLLDSLIKQIVLTQQADILGITADQQTIDAQMQGYASQFGSDEAFVAELNKQGYSKEDLQKDIASGIRINQLIQQEVGSKMVQITEDEARSYYTANPEEFTQPEQVRASHILIQVASNASDDEKTKAYKKAEAVLEKVKEGLDFGDLAKEYSEGPSGPNGGDLNYFGRGQMVPAFEEAAFALDVGEVSDIVETQFGYHIIKVFDKKAAQLIPFDTYKGKIIDAMNQKKYQAAYEDYLQQLEDKASISKYL